MHDISTSVVPAGVIRRLVLQLCGWRLVDGCYQYGEQHLSEEQLDTMPAEAWERFMRPWLTSAAN
jgi:hypothetical protein